MTIPQKPREIEFDHLPKGTAVAGTPDGTGSPGTGVLASLLRRSWISGAISSNSLGFPSTFDSSNAS
jgi:hypothetical protein